MCTLAPHFRTRSPNYTRMYMHNNFRRSLCTHVPTLALLMCNQIVHARGYMRVHARARTRESSTFAHFRISHPHGTTRSHAQLTTRVRVMRRCNCAHAPRTHSKTFRMYYIISIHVHVARHFRKFMLSPPPLALAFS